MQDKQRTNHNEVLTQIRNWSRSKSRSFAWEEEGAVEDQRKLCLADAESIARAARLLERGAVIAFPTDTVYGLCCDLFNRRAVARLYEIKGRPAHMPLIAMFADSAQWRQVASARPDPAGELMRRWWPGPLTIILPARADIPPEVLGGGDTIGTRIPNLPIALQLLRQVGRPLATTSANRSGQPATTSATAVAEELGEQLDLILGGGHSPGGIASTVVDCTTTPPAILREGPITAEMLGIWKRVGGNTEEE